VTSARGKGARGLLRDTAFRYLRIASQSPLRIVRPCITGFLQGDHGPSTEARCCYRVEGVSQGARVHSRSFSSRDRGPRRGPAQIVLPRDGRPGGVVRFKQLDSSSRRHSGERSKLKEARRRNARSRRTRSRRERIEPPKDDPKKPVPTAEEARAEPAAPNRRRGRWAPRQSTPARPRKRRPPPHRRARARAGKPEALLQLAAGHKTAPPVEKSRRRR
jgi:hypothetical protein